jgi:hypothetical protein
MLWICGKLKPCLNTTPQERAELWLKNLHVWCDESAHTRRPIFLSVIHGMWGSPQRSYQNLNYGHSARSYLPAEMSRIGYTVNITYAYVLTRWHIFGKSVSIQVGLDDSVMAFIIIKKFVLTLEFARYNFNSSTQYALRLSQSKSILWSGRVIEIVVLGTPARSQLLPDQPATQLIDWLTEWQVTYLSNRLTG